MSFGIIGDLFGVVIGVLLIGTSNLLLDNIYFVSMLCMVIILP